MRNNLFPAADAGRDTDRSFRCCFPGSHLSLPGTALFFTIPLNFCAILCKYTAFLPVFKGFLLFFLKMLGKISKEGLSYRVCLIT